MNREFLKSLGLDDEAVEKAMAEHGKVVNATKDELATIVSERDSYKTQLTDRDTQLEDLRGKADGNTALQATIDALKQANADAKATHQAELSATKLNYELDQALLINKSRNPIATKALLKMEDIKLGEDGQLTGLTDQLTALKESDGYLFDEGSATPPPAGHMPGAQQKHNDPGKPDAYQAGVKMYEQLKQNKRI